MKTRFAKGVLIALLLTPVVFSQAPQTPEAMLGAALHHERVTGNLQAAIDGFRKVLAAKGAPRSVAAQAQFHIALCYEKLGNQEARKAFESVVKNYADQKDLAAQASVRLAAMAPAAATAVRTRLLWDNAADVGGRASADGRFLTFLDWTTCDLAVRDLVTGQNRNVTKYAGCMKQGFVPEGSAISPDGKVIAFGVRHRRNPEIQRGQQTNVADLRTIGMDGSNERILLAGNDLDYAYPLSWTPDGKWIVMGAVFRNESYEEDMLLLVSAGSGNARKFRVKDKLWPYNAAASPDGKWIAYSIRPTGSKATLLVRPLADESATETVVAENAMMMGWTPDGKGLLISRNRDGSRELHLIPMADGKATGEALSTYTATDVGETPAGITSNGTLIFSTDNRRADTVVASWNGKELDASTSTFQIPATTGMGYLLVGGAGHFSYDGKRLAVVTATQSIAIREMDTGGVRTITPRLQAWRSIRWSHDGQALLVLGMDNAIPGIYRVDAETGSTTLLAKVPEETWGFTPSRDGKTLFHGTPRKTQAHDLATGTDKVIFESTLVGPYDLRVSHDGNRLAIRGGRYIAIVNLRDGSAREIFRIPESDPSVLWALDWDANDARLVAIARGGGMANNLELWVFSPEGGEPIKQKISAAWHGLSFTPDAKFVATTKLTQRSQVWAIENFLPGSK